MQLSAVTQTGQQNTALENIIQTSGGTNETDRATALASADFQSFLQLLTAQISNQDPLSPLESTQFVEQLASFSGLEQQIATNERLDTLLGQVADRGLSTNADIIGLGQLIGQYVSTSDTVQQFIDKPIRFSVPDILARQPSQNAIYEIRNSDGTVVYSKPHDGQSVFEWNGQKRDGNIAPQGDYSLFVTEHNSTGENQIIARGMVLSEVRQVHVQNEQPLIVLQNGTSALLPQIEGIVSDKAIADL